MPNPLRLADIPHHPGPGGGVRTASSNYPIPFREAFGKPMPVAIVRFGGVLDMTDLPDLSGRIILVVEDEYLIANDTAAALREAGAEVMGPCPDEEAAGRLLDRQRPTHALVDLNLGGGGPRFELARRLREGGVPFVFLTGYDPDVIPPDFDDVTLLCKPITFRAIIEAISHI